MTGNDVLDIALTLLDEDSETERNEARIVRVIDALQRELAFYEGINVTSTFSSIYEELQISDDTASRIMPYGVAANFALEDRNGDLYNDYAYMYRALCRTISKESNAEDVYGY